MKSEFGIMNSEFGMPPIFAVSLWGAGWEFRIPNSEFRIGRVGVWTS